jgi:hypothetical protein
MAGVGALAEKAFSDAEAALARCAKDAMRPAVIMMMVYRRHLDRQKANAWRPLPPRGPWAKARDSAAKLWTAIQYGLF